jgi:methylase of polypeptide subunit release factors
MTASLRGAVSGRSSGSPVRRPATVRRDLSDGGRPVERLTFGGLDLIVPVDLLRPRPWTLLQCEWASEIASSCPEGAVVELCSGAGHLGLEAARRTDRSAILVDAHPDACRAASDNAARNGLAGSVEVRCATVDRALRPDDQVGMVLADPPYVPSREVGGFAEDPAFAIDGGHDGLVLVRRALVAASAFPTAPVLLQIRGEGQLAGLVPWLAGLRGVVSEVRALGADRAVALIRWR